MSALEIRSTSFGGFKITPTSLLLPTTCQLVRIWPCEPIMEPDPDPSLLSIRTTDGEIFLNRAASLTPLALLATSGLREFAVTNNVFKGRSSFAI
jgi:hypothetical protein